jgi:hypothetical protein
MLSDPAECFPINFVGPGVRQEESEVSDASWPVGELTG